MAESGLPEQATGRTLPPDANEGRALPPGANQGRPSPSPPETCADNPLLNNCRDPADRVPPAESTGERPRPPSRPPSSGPVSSEGPPSIPLPATPPSPIAELSDPNSTPLERASAVLDTRCGSCHGYPNPSVCGTCDEMFGIGDLALMIQSDEIEACRWTDSRIFRRVLDRSMPPEASGLPAPTTEEFEVVRDFVNGICGSLTNGGPEDTERVTTENLLREDCSACHSLAPPDAGPTGPTGPNFIDGVNDIAELISAELILPCDSAASPLVQRLRDGSMPPPDSLGPRPTAAQIAAVAAFIDRPCTAR
jgi:hypothetical protein